MNKLALGSAQFGMDYGINNQRGMIPETEVFEILDMASAHGVDMLDTASSYGKSEEIIGNYLKRKGDRFKVVSKLPRCAPDQVRDIFESSLKKLGLSSIYGYLIHDFKDYLDNPKIWKILRELKEKGKIKKIGFSLYYPLSLEFMKKNAIDPDLIQVPYNLFDQRFAKEFKKMKELNIEVHARSLFLQGLLFKKPEALSSDLAKMRGRLTKLNDYAKRKGMRIIDLAIGFAALNKYIDKTIVGVDNVSDFQGILESVNNLTLSGSELQAMAKFKVDDEKLILPIKWGQGSMNQNKTKVVAIIQARVGSTRLPGKVLKDLEGKTVLERVIERVKASEYVDKVVVATTVSLNDLSIVRLCAEAGVSVYCGSQEDVLDRYYQAAKLFEAEHVVRITSDCPMIDPKIIDLVIRTHLISNADYTSTGLKSTFPDGEDVEAIAFTALKKAWQKARLASDREHVTPFIKKNTKLFKLLAVENKVNLSKKRWTLDNQEDYEFIKIIYKKLYRANPFFGVKEILKYLKINPEIEKINHHIPRNAGYIKSLREDKLLPIRGMING